MEAAGIKPEAPLIPGSVLNPLSHTQHFQKHWDQGAPGNRTSQQSTPGQSKHTVQKHPHTHCRQLPSLLQQRRGASLLH